MLFAFWFGVLFCCILMSPAAAKAAGENSSLAIVQAGVQQADDAPFVPSDYQFYPGDYIYFTFEVSGFGIRSNADGTTRSMSLTIR